MAKKLTNKQTKHKPWSFYLLAGDEEGQMQSCLYSIQASDSFPLLTATGCRCCKLFLRSLAKIGPPSFISVKLPMVTQTGIFVHIQGMRIVFLNDNTMSRYLDLRSMRLSCILFWNQPSPSNPKAWSWTGIFTSVTLCSFKLLLFWLLGVCCRRVMTSLMTPMWFPDWISRSIRVQALSFQKVLHSLCIRSVVI